MRTEIKTALKVKFIPAKGNLQPRANILQLSNGRKLMATIPAGYSGLNLLDKLLTNCTDLKEYHIILDITQDESLLVGLTFYSDFGFSNIIQQMKDLIKKGVVK